MIQKRKDIDNGLISLGSIKHTFFFPPSIGCVRLSKAYLLASLSSDEAFCFVYFYSSFLHIIY